MFLPEIKHSSSPAENQRVLDVHIPAELTHFVGHFPGLPILPGVVQVDWAARWGQDFFNISGAFLALDNLKFQDMVFPGDLLQLSLSWQPDTARLSFSYTRKDAQGTIATVSAGRFQFAQETAA